MSVLVPGRVCYALKMYLDQEPRRSLRQLAGECANHSIKASLPTLKRWSVRYRWQQLVAEHDRAATEESIAKTIDFQARAVQAHFKLIDSAKRRYDWILDPNNPNLTPAQRRRATRVTVSDYVRLLKIETELYKRPEHFEARRSVDPEEPTGSYTDEELHVMIRALAQHRHGLPPG
jgi:hypothetical protein